jgi:hypothetical protein
VPPSALSISPNPPTLNEGNAISLSGIFTDPGTADTFTLTVDWGDGQTTTTNLAEGIRLFQLPHTYLDDGVASDSRTVVVTVTDDDLGSVTNSTTVTVNNLNPMLGNVAVTSSVFPGATATVTGSFSDASPLDAFTVTVNWGDGSAAQLLNFPAGPGSFNAQHQYLVVNSNALVTITLRDDDNGSALVTTNIVIRPLPDKARFLSISNAPNSRTILKLQGTPNAFYRVEGSASLVSWDTLGSRTAGADGLFEFEDATPPRPPRLFYRAVAP